mgnify:CR=1 FL=1
MFKKKWDKQRESKDSELIREQKEIKKNADYMHVLAFWKRTVNNGFHNPGPEWP